MAFQPWPDQHSAITHLAMPDKVRPTVPEAVRAFLIVCLGAPDVWERMERFIARLRADPRWSEEEVREVESLIVERITA